MRRLGLVVHPTRDLDDVLEEVRGWAQAHEVEVGQVMVTGQSRRVADPSDAEACEVIVALGGDGTTLAALHAGAEASRPVLGIACGSVGMLTAVHADHVSAALEMVYEGHWHPLHIPGLDVAAGAGRHVAINDLAVIRAGAGQLIVSITLDGALYARVAGDGLVVATPVGSSAYTMAAGGPLLAPGAEGMAVTPLAPHGGSVPPLVTGAGSEVALAVEPGFGGVRYEFDGRPAEVDGHDLTVGWLPDYATLVRLADDEPRLAGLRRRGLVQDSPRVLVREGRLGKLKRPVPPAR
jgi:NAD+ kinase